MSALCLCFPLSIIFPLHISFLFRFAPLYISCFLCCPGWRETKCIAKDLCHTRNFPDSRRHLRLCFPLTISYLCTFLFYALTTCKEEVFKKMICAIPGPSRTVGIASVYAFLLACLSSAHFFPLYGPPLNITDFLCSPDRCDEMY